MAVDLTDLGFVLTQAGGCEPAESVQFEALALEQRLLQDPHLLLGATLSDYGECLIRMKQHADAEKILIEAHDVLGGVLGEQHERTLRAVERLAKLYQTRGQADMAARYDALLSKPETARR